MRKAILFVETGEVRVPVASEFYETAHGVVSSKFDCSVSSPPRPVLRRLPDDWLERAKEAILTLYLHEDTHPDDEEIIAAILGPPPGPEPEQCDIDAAELWFTSREIGLEVGAVLTLARAFAKHRREHSS